MASAVQLVLSVKELVKDVGSRVSFEKPLRKCRKIIADDIAENFRGQHDPDGNPWAPPKRPLRPRGRKLLRKTKRLYRSVTMASGPDVQVIVNRTGLTVGTDVPYAQYHQFGTRKMVARPFMGISEKAQDAIDDVLNDYVDAVLKGE